MKKRTHSCMRAVLAMFVLSALMMPVARASETNPIVVELFTSQGCSSCPPADEVLANLAERPDVIALSFHVDYWDYLGWKDPFASATYTERQRAYRLPLHKIQIYTPQMVIGGVKEMPGYSISAVRDAVAAVANVHPPGPELSLHRENDGAITVAVAAAQQRGDVFIASYAPRQTTPVRRGENTGRTLTNANVVQRFARLKAYDGTALSVSTPPNFAKAGEGIAAWLQAAGQGPILSASRLAPAP